MYNYAKEIRLGIAIFSTLLGIASLVSIEQKANSISPYDSGYNHGCSDAHGGNYINEPGHGPAFHTPDFMRGYNDGKTACTENVSSSGSSGRLPNSPFTGFPCVGGSGKRYCTGYHEGAVSADNDYAKGNLGFHGCPASHTAEYCSGFERGYNDEAGDLA
jgi:hypothetical protein